MAYLRDINSMDKKELIGFILNDIKELGLVVEGMHEMDKIPKAMQELAISKTRNILDRFCQLGEIPQKMEILSEILTEKKNLFVSGQKPEKIRKEEIFSGKIEEEKEEENTLEQSEPQEENIVELVREKTSADDSQKIESKEERTIFQPQLLFEEEAKEKIYLTVDQQPEEEKGTIIVEEEKVQERTTNEKFKSRVSSVNPVVTSGKRIESRFVQNLRRAINLNDRYRYQKELFGGNAELMNSVLDKLDAMGSLEEAMLYAQKEFTWDAESGTVTDFYLLLESRFS